MGLLTGPLPDEYGLSEDSLRGSTQHILPHTVNNEGLKNPNDASRSLTRRELSSAERETLRQQAVFVDENGNGIDDRDEIVRLAPPSYFLPNLPSSQTAEYRGALPDGGWVWRDGEWMWRGSTPPQFAPPSESTGYGASAGQRDAVQHFAEHIKANTKPLLAEDSPPVPFGQEQAERPSSGLFLPPEPPHRYPDNPPSNLTAPEPPRLDQGESS